MADDYTEEPDRPKSKVEDISLEVIGICHLCKHQSRSNPMKCDAFPDGIPRSILVGDFIHTEPFKGDHGIQFEAKRKEHPPSPPQEWTN